MKGGGDQSLWREKKKLKKLKEFMGGLKTQMCMPCRFLLSPRVA